MATSIEKNRPDIPKSIIDLVLSGKGEVEIQNILLVGRKPIHRICKRENLYDQLKTNNRRYKSFISIERAKNTRNDVLIELDKKYGEKIEKWICDGWFFKDIKKEMKVSDKRVVLYLKHKGLNDKRKENSKKRIGELARKNGKMSAISLKGKEIKPITQKIIDRFFQLKKDLLYKKRVYDQMKLEFGLGSKKIRQLCDKFGYPKDNPQTGKLNPMYGKSPGYKSGIGVKCWIVMAGYHIFCRSSLELKVYFYLMDNNIPFTQSKHRIKYMDGNRERTYNPDIVIEDVIYEIKPESMTKVKINEVKHLSAKIYCKENKLKYGGFITENTFDIKKYGEMDYINEKISLGNIIIDEKNFSKFRKYHEYKNS